MRKVFLAVMAILTLWAVSVGAETVPCVAPCIVQGQGGTITGETNMTGTMGITHSARQEDVYSTMGILELFGTHETSNGTGQRSNTFYSDLQMTATDTATSGQVTVNYNQLGLGGASGVETVENDLSTFVSSLKLGDTDGAAGRTYTVGTDIANARLSFGSPSAAQQVFNAQRLIGLYIKDAGSQSGASNGGIDITLSGGLALMTGIYIDDMVGLSDTGTATTDDDTIPTQSAIWLEESILGDTNNYGIVLDGDSAYSFANDAGLGSAIVFGADQDAKIYWDGTNLELNTIAGGGGAQVSDGHDIDVYNNIFHYSSTQSQYWGPYLVSNNGVNQYLNINFYNNTVYTNCTNTPSCRVMSFYHTGDMKNNIFYTVGGGNDLYVTGSTTTEDYNLWYPAKDSSDAGAFSQANNPLFTNIATQDFTVRDCSSLSTTRSMCAGKIVIN